MKEEMNWSKYSSTNAPYLEHKECVKIGVENAY